MVEVYSLKLYYRRVGNQRKFTMDFSDLNRRSLDIFRNLVDTYLETGEPVGSRTLSQKLEASLSPATIRNVMADLEDAGLLYAPHTSAGRLPTDAGLQFFVNGLLEVGSLSESECHQLEESCHIQGRRLEDVLNEATTLLSGLTQCAGIVLAPKLESPLKQIEFVHIGDRKALAVIMTQDGLVENRVIEFDSFFSQETLKQASNYLTHILSGKTLSEARTLLSSELHEHQKQLDKLAKSAIKEGFAVWAGDEKTARSLIVKGQANLLQNVKVLDEIDRIRDLFNILEAKENFATLLDAAINAEGVQIFVGAENELFKLSGCSVVVAPYKNSQQKIIGAIGVLGPTRMHYGKVIPLVDYTARMIGKILSS